MPDPKRPEDIEYQLVPHTRIREAIAERVTTSNREIPVFRMHALVDASALVAARRELKEEHGDEAPTYNDLILKCVASALRNHPRFNGWYTNEGVKCAKEVNVGFAVATDDGVLLPTTFRTDETDLLDLADQTKQLAQWARAGKLRASRQMGATFTISNVGPAGVDAFDAVISPPQTGILAIGSLTQRPIVVQGELAVRPTIWLTLSVDHRAADGMDAARFLAELKSTVESYALA